MPSTVRFYSILIVFGVCKALSSSGCTEKQDHFRDPPSRQRPRFRYWLPDASVDPDVVKADIKSAGSIGAGGVEFLPFYNYGGELGGPPLGVDWSTYGFGTPAYLQLFTSALEAHKEGGMAMDFSLGPNQGQGIPAHHDDEGLQWDLVTTAQELSFGGTFNYTIPGWGGGELVAAISAMVVSRRNVSYNVTAITGLSTVTYEDLILKNGSLEDVTNMVSEDGSLLLEVPEASPGGLGYELFFFYQKLSHNQNVHFSSNTTGSIWDNGSYVVDHFSARGAQKVQDFWEHYILAGNVKELLKETGNYGWEDSLEIKSNVSWTPTLPTRFMEVFGYDLRPYLPLIAFGNNNINIQNNSPGSIQCKLDTPDQGEGYVNDYRAVLAKGYQEYLATLSRWLQSLGLGLSSQPSYNMPMDMEASIPFVDAPECESLQWHDNVDGYRQFSGPANLARKKVISNELGAISGRAYSLTIPELLFAMNRAVSGGVNQFVIHGQSYTGNYPQTTWPGYTAFIYYISELYSAKRPDWDHGFHAALDYMARIQHIQQKGIPRTDVAFYNKQTVTDPNMATLYRFDDLTKQGWSYAYLSPDNLNLPQAYVEDNLLAPADARFQALVVLGSQNVTQNSLVQLKVFADAGLPVIMAGGVPAQYATQNRTAIDERLFNSSLTDFLQHKHVKQVVEGEVSQSLEYLGLKPRVGVRTNGTWYTTWREDAADGISYAYIFGDTAAASGEVVVEATGIPYFFNPWTGTREPVLNYKTEGHTTVIPLKLAGNQTKIIAFSQNPIENVKVPKFYATDLSENVIGYNVNLNGVLLHVAATPKSTLLTLSTGKTVQHESKAPDPFELKTWELVLELWEAPSNMSDATIKAVKSNTTHQLSNLVSWTEIDAAANASGVGYYHTNFTWPPGSVQDNSVSLGAYIRFPPVLNAITVYINGARLAPLDYVDPIIDITQYLISGSNDIVAVVPSTMWNYLRSILPGIRSSGRQFLQLEAIPKTENGLVGVVSVVPFEFLHIVP
ncbi:Secreted protein [Colletotrichum higginsianum IMI 349063]|uniref:Secreted protein n=1 Tax=Colletotrichum higginsianum (strain IMI 349063) TaxID=759273 RepID=A0A1B7YSI3_COLHI|nr:Secreted protein [Colletotrichum higginsianum IMI 349063]OBR14858.1 Secreted protein [Colletotrichum higginsianum IMI 349063]